MSRVVPHCSCYQFSYSVGLVFYLNHSFPLTSVLVFKKRSVVGCLARIHEVTLAIFRFRVQLYSNNITVLQCVLPMWSLPYVFQRQH